MVAPAEPSAAKQVDRMPPARLRKPADCHGCSLMPEVGHKQSSQRRAVSRKDTLSMTSIHHAGLPVSAPLFWLPASFDAGDVLPDRLRKRRDDANWFVNTILRKASLDDVDSHGYVRLHSAILRRVMSRRHYVAVEDALVEAGTIELPAPYYAGVKSKGFRISEKHLSEGFRTIEPRDRRLIGRIQREWERMEEDQRQRWLPIHHELAAIQRDITIMPQADAILESLPPTAHLCQNVLIENIRACNFKLTVSNTERVFNAVTGLKRELRGALRLHGEPIGGVDIRCAQPALLAVLMRLRDGGNVPTYIQTLLGRLRRDVLGRRLVFGLTGLTLALSSDAPAPSSDLGLFEDLVFGGSLYEALVLDCLRAGVRMPGDSRNWVKRALLRDVLAKHGNYRSDFECVFRERFPSVLAFVRWINRANYAELIRTLQRLESWLVIEQVAPNLVGKAAIISLHDALYGRVSDIPVIQSAFQETLENLGLRLALKAESDIKQPLAMEGML